VPNNDKLETLIIRDMRLAYGLPYDIDFIHKFTKLKIFVVEINDLRGSDKLTFPKIIVELTQALSNFTTLECV
jgi:hypothetical protein